MVYFVVCCMKYLLPACMLRAGIVLLASVCLCICVSVSVSVRTNLENY